MTKLGDLMDRLNLFFTSYFTLELAINMYSHWFTLFVNNGWNHLDVFIVFMSLVDLGANNIPNWFVQLMRALRVIRLFGRISALKKMTDAVTASLFPMMNAFIILIIVLSICKYHIQIWYSTASTLIYSEIFEYFHCFKAHKEPNCSITFTFSRRSNQNVKCMVAK